MRPSRPFAVLLLLSGFCGISYEILYARILGNLVGDQFAVVASILLTFLLGIGFGTLYAHRLWRWLWLLEALIGGCGLFFALGTELLDAWLYAALPVLGTGLAASMLVCFLLLSLPAFLIGTSLPLFAGYLSRLNPGEKVFARAYTLYNFGAGLTALLIEFALLRLLGLRGAVITMVSLNLFVAVALLAGYGGLRELRPASRDAVRFAARPLVALALASVASAVFQLLMVKLAECLLGPFRETFALVLAWILLGIALGSRLTERHEWSFSRVVLLALAGLVWLLAMFPTVAWLYAWLHGVAMRGYAMSVLFKLGVLGLLMGLPAVSFGATIPALLTTQRHVARESGQLLFVSSVANAGGFLLMAFVLHRHLDYGWIVLVVAALATVAVWVHGRRIVLAGAMGLAALAAHAGLWDENLLYLGHTSFHRTRDLREARDKFEFPDKFKGYQDVFSITWSDGQPWFFINGYLSIPLDSPSEKLVGAFSSLFAPRADKALVLGLGSGATAGAVSLLFERTDAVEINPVVLENLFRMAEWNFDIENLPGVRIVQDDAIHFAKTSDERYSLIINTVTTPLYFSSSKLYTKDFLETIEQRLLPDGVYVTWMDLRVGDRGADIIFRTVTETFADCWIGFVNTDYYLLLCSNQELQVHQPGLVAANATLRDYFLDEGLRPEWLHYGLLSTRVHELAAERGGRMNTLDYPALEFEMAVAVYRSMPSLTRELAAQLDFEDLSEALRGLPDWDPVGLSVYTELLLGEDAPLSLRRNEVVRANTPDFERRRSATRVTYLTALAEQTDQPGFWHGLGVEQLEHGNYREAIEAFERALALDPDIEGAHFNLAYCHEMLERYDLALAAYAREIELDPQGALARYRRGVVFLKTSRFPEALEEFDAALALDGSDAEAHYGRGQALVALRRLGDAERAFRDALERDPRHDQARRALDRIERLAR